MACDLSADGLRLNLGCGNKHRPGYINVDLFGEPDVRHDLESLPWPWESDSVSEIQLVHVLEHLGQCPKVFLGIMKEMYRVCQNGAKVFIIVPHFRSDHFFDDPTHVRVVTPCGLRLFSRRLNKETIAAGGPDSPLGQYLNVDFELEHTKYVPSAHWFRLHPEKQMDMSLIEAESTIHNNLLEQIEMVLRVVK